MKDVAPHALARLSSAAFFRDAQFPEQANGATARMKEDRLYACCRQPHNQATSITPSANSRDLGKAWLAQHLTNAPKRGCLPLRAGR